MGDIFDIIIAVLVFTIFILLIRLAFTYKTKSEREYEEKLKKSLADEYIIDPETGAKLTLEQAESGYWVAHDNEFNTVSEKDIDKLPTEDEKIAHIALNYLKGSRNYMKIELSEIQFNVIKETKILNSYDDWSYSNPFKFEKGIVFLPVPELHGNNHYQIDYAESHVMFWVNIKNINGHYLFREKTSSEKFLDLLRNDDEIKLQNYECFTFKKSLSFILIKPIIESFKNEKGLEVELHNDNLFIKNTKLVNLSDIENIEKIIKQVS
ncbi:hypothetical protein [Algibacter sp. 2305UL17-15]|uniref:hypothetical protein n=1 Tax=Algibacter sp. 2305UL17-15 TaxID=3231268 RepID=UPI003459848E